MKTILSLFDYSGNWSRPYRDNGYEVIQVDILLNSIDVRLLKYLDSRNIHGILACPPCTYFSQARSKPTNDELIIGLSTADAVFRMVQIYKPKFYCIENPYKSRLWHYIGKPKQVINLNWFGYECYKKTGLYGSFNKVKCNSEHANTNIKQFESIEKKERSTTPELFGKAFFEVNK